MKNTEVSLFKDVYTKMPLRTENLYTLCTTVEYKDSINSLRNFAKGSKEYNTIKKTLPCFTPSMICTQRGSEYMIAHTGFVCIDWDNVNNPTELKQILKGFSFISFAAESCSGRGVYAIIKIEKSNLHQQHYESLLEFFEKLGYSADSACKDIARLRIVSYDSHPYYNENATVWQRIKLPQQPSLNQIKVNTKSRDINESAIYAVRNYVVANCIDITSGRGNWLALGNYIYSVLGTCGESIFCDVSQFHPKYKVSECSKLFRSFNKSKFNPCIGVLLNACRRSGVPNLKELL